MLFNYFKVAFRNLSRHKTYTAINTIGFAVGLACCLLIGLYVRHELSYDRFHEKADRTYRMILDSVILDNEIESPLTPAPMAATLVSDFPEVEHATRIRGTEIFDDAELVIEYGDKRFTEQRVYFADSSLFNVFSFHALSGNPSTMLAAPNSIVLTASMAAKYFGQEEALGKSLLINEENTFLITGIIEDVPTNSHWQFDFLVSLSTLPASADTDWFNNSLYTYFTTQPDADIHALEEKLKPFVNEQVSPRMSALLGMNIDRFHAEGGKLEYYAQPLLDIHLYSNLRKELQPNGDIQSVYIFVTIAFLILLIASANFINLSTAQSAGRSKEVGVRKVLGSRRHQLKLQFLIEAQLLCLASISIALVIIWRMLPMVNERLGTAMTLPLDAPLFVPILLLTIIGVSTLAGIYPAFYLSSFAPAKVLKGQIRTGMKGGRLRKSLVIAQFTITFVLATTTGLVYQQMQYVQNKRLGFDAEQVITLDLTSVDRQNVKAFKQEIQLLSGVQSLASIDHVPDRLISNAGTYRPATASTDDLEVIWQVYADENIIETLDMHLLAGEGLSSGDASGIPAVLLNQKAVDLFGWEDPVGELLASQEADNNFRVAGILEDFHFESLHEEVKPIVIALANDANLNHVAVRLNPNVIPQTLASIQLIWTSFYPETPATFSFLDDQLDALYRNDQQQAQLFGLFTGLAIFIACLGLFGLAAFMTEQRIKEVGVRKVMGASVAQILVLFSRDFLSRIAISFVIGAPIALLLIRHWLDRFAYKLPVSAGVFALAGLAVILIVLATISFHSIRAALANPINALRYE